MTAHLLHRVARCEPDAFEECIDRYGGLVWSLARRYCPSEGDAEDAVQETFISLWKSAARFDPNRANEASFVATVARRRMIDAFRDRRRRPAPIEDVDQGAEWKVDAPNPQAGAEASSVGRLLAELSDLQRQVIELSVYGGLSHAEISERLEMPLGTVKSHARRGLLQLRERVQGGPQ